MVVKPKEVFYMNRNKIAEVLRNLRKQHGCRCVKHLTRIVRVGVERKVTRLPFSKAIQEFGEKRYLLWNNQSGSTKAVEIN
jgi:hypothetical protein